MRNLSFVNVFQVAKVKRNLHIISKVAITLSIYETDIMRCIHKLNQVIYIFSIVVKTRDGFNGAITSLQ